MKSYQIDNNINTIQKKPTSGKKTLPAALPVQLIGKDNTKDNASKASFSSPIQLKHNSGSIIQKASAPKNDTGLPNNIKSGVEQLSGVSLNDVKVHYNSSAPTQLHAHAYAQGTDIHVAPGQEKHLPHEAWHVVQQKQGRVKPTTQLKGKVPVNDDAGLEKEADVMGAKAVQMKTIGSETPIQNKSISYTAVAQLGMLDSIKRMFGYGKKKTRDAIGNEDMLPLEDKQALHEIRNEGKGRRNAFGNADMLPLEDKKAIHDLRRDMNGGKNILKFNFAGSGEKEWKTHKPDYRKANLNKGAKSPGGGEKYEKQKLDKLVFEYAGPIAKTLRKKGIQDKGENSTAKNLENAQAEFKKVWAEMEITKGEGKPASLEVEIKGFSRGAATANVFAKWIKETYADVTVNLVSIDPVHGTGSWDNSKKGTMGLMDSEVDLVKIDNSTYVVPMQSGHWGSYFTPQKISNYSRILIMYGPNAKHSMGMGGLTGSVLTWNGQPIKGMKLGDLPKGLLVADSSNKAVMPIVHITSQGQWDQVRPKIAANSKEKRDKIIDAAFEEYIKTGKVNKFEASNPMIKTTTSEI